MNTLEPTHLVEHAIELSHTACKFELKKYFRSHSSGFIYFFIHKLDCLTSLSLLGGRRYFFSEMNDVLQLCYTKLFRDVVSNSVHGVFNHAWQDRCNQIIYATNNNQRCPLSGYGITRSVHTFPEMRVRKAETPRLARLTQVGKSADHQMASPADRLCLLVG